MTRLNFYMLFSLTLMSACGTVVNERGSDADPDDGGPADSGVILPKLSSLTVDTVAPLTPVFSPRTFAYTLNVGDLSTEISLRAETLDPAATLTVQSMPAISRKDMSVPLMTGLTSIDVLVQATSGMEQTYAIDVTRSLALSQTNYLKAEVINASDDFGRVIALDGNTLAVGVPLEDGGARGINPDRNVPNQNDSGAIYIYRRSSDGDSWVQEAYIKAANADTGDRFGASVALKGDTLVVGATEEASGASGVRPSDGGPNADDDNANASGAVYVFSRTASTWTQEAYIKASNTDSNDRFGKSVALFDDTLVVGAVGEGSNAMGTFPGNGAAADDDTASASGAVYVFSRTAATWTQQAYIKASNTDRTDAFGTSVALFDDTLVVGAIREDGIMDLSSNSGAAYVFLRTDDTWAEQAYLTSTNADQDDQFGSNLALFRDTLVVGVPLEDSNARGVFPSDDGVAADNNDTSRSGAVYVFTRSAGSWRQQAYIKASNTEGVTSNFGDQFGKSIALFGDTLVVGAQNEDGDTTTIAPGSPILSNGSTESGAAYVFQRDGSSWSQIYYVKAENAEAFDNFGMSIALFGDTLVVSAPQEDSGNSTDPLSNAVSDSGAIYTFR